MQNIVIFIYSQEGIDLNAKSSDTHICAKDFGPPLGSPPPPPRFLALALVLAPIFSDLGKCLILNVLPLVSNLFSVRIKRVMTVYENYNVIAFKFSDIYSVDMVKKMPFTSTKKKKSF